MILIATVTGFTSPAMATFGSHTKKQPGPHIKREDGFGSPTTAGRGSVTSHGAGRHIITDGGSTIATHGAGGLDRFTSTTVRCGLRRSSSLSALDIIQASALAPLDGFPWARMIRSTRGTGAASIA